jgi:hypothetical protein
MNIEEAPKTQEVSIADVNRYATNLFLRGKNTLEIERDLRARGLDDENIQSVMLTVEVEAGEAIRTKAHKDMLSGALWCVGGIVLTMAHIGYIFWGAIVFGGIQFFRGVFKSV